MPKVLRLFLLLAMAFAATAATPSRTTQSAPTLLKRTVAISTKRFLRYWPNPRAAEPQYNTYSWTPALSFQMLGPLAGGSQLVFEVSMPDGKPWISFKLRTPEAGDDEFVKINGPDLSGRFSLTVLTVYLMKPFKTVKNHEPSMVT